MTKNINETVKGHKDPERSASAKVRKPPPNPWKTITELEAAKATLEAKLKEQTSTSQVRLEAYDREIDEHNKTRARLDALRGEYVAETNRRRKSETRQSFLFDAVVAYRSLAKEFRRKRWWFPNSEAINYFEQRVADCEIGLAKLDAGESHVVNPSSSKLRHPLGASSGEIGSIQDAQQANNMRDPRTTAE